MLAACAGDEFERCAADCRALTVRGGGVDAIITALHLHESNPVVVEHGCRALGSLAAEGTHMLAERAAQLTTRRRRQLRVDCAGQRRRGRHQRASSANVEHRCGRAGLLRP
jgi:hypothetical protein